MLIETSGFLIVFQGPRRHSVSAFIVYEEGLLKRILEKVRNFKEAGKKFKFYVATKVIQNFETHQ
jgi:hypothetical protein